MPALVHNIPATLPHQRPRLSCTEQPTRPGLTSLVRTGRGLMTIQTELVGDPVQVVTIVDFRGRVLKRWTHPLSFDPEDLRLTNIVREWHQQQERSVRDSLAKVVRKRRPLPPIERAISRMYLAGMHAYARRDFAAAEVAWRACARLLPEDRRVQSALARVQS